MSDKCYLFTNQRGILSPRPCISSLYTETWQAFLLRSQSNSQSSTFGMESSATEDFKVDSPVEIYLYSLLDLQVIKSLDSCKVGYKGYWTSCALDIWLCNVYEFN